MWKHLRNQLQHDQPDARYRVDIDRPDTTIIFNQKASHAQLRDLKMSRLDTEEKVRLPCQSSLTPAKILTVEELAPPAACRRVHTGL